MARSVRPKIDESPVAQHGVGYELSLAEVLQARLPSVRQAVGKKAIPVAVAGSEKSLSGKPKKVAVKGPAIRSRLQT